MNKIFLTFIILTAFVTIPLTVDANCSTQDSELLASNDEYTAIAEPSTLRYNPYAPSVKWMRSKEVLYIRSGSCGGSYYLTDGTYYYPARKNTDTTVDGKDVSKYEWKCTVGDRTYWFDY